MKQRISWSNVGIEYSDDGVIGPSMLKVQLWVDGKPIGRRDEETYLPSFLASLLRVEHLPLSRRTLLPSMSAIDDLDERSDAYRIILGDTFDDFSVRGFRDGTKLVLLWKLHERRDSTHVDLTPGVEHQAVVDLEEWKTMVEEFRSQVQPRLDAARR